MIFRKQIYLPIINMHFNFNLKTCFGYIFCTEMYF